MTLILGLLIAVAVVLFGFWLIATVPADAMGPTARKVAKGLLLLAFLLWALHAFGILQHGTLP